MLNSAIVMGRLTADPELRHTATSNIPVTSFTLAVGRSFVKAGSERQTDFLDVVAWNKTAEFVARYFRKGQMMAVEGRIETRSYEDKNGNKRKAVEIIAENVHFAESKRDGSGAGAPAGRSDTASQMPASFSNSDGNDFQEIQDFDDDLPF